MMKNNNSYKLPLALVFSLFFLWAISSNLLPTMIRQLMKTCELNTFEASFTETAYWLAYFIFPIPIAMFMKRYSHKAGIIFGLVLAAAGVGIDSRRSGCGKYRRSRVVVFDVFHRLGFDFVS